MPRGLIRFLLVVIVPVLVIAAGIFIWTLGGRYVSTENAYVKNDIVDVSTEIDGRVTEVPVQDHAQVAEGDILFRIDPVPFEIALARAQAELDGVINRLHALRAEYRVAEAQLGEAEKRLQFHSRQVERYRSLRSRGAASEVRLDEEQLSLALAQEQITVIRERMQQIMANLGGSLDLPTEKHPLFLEALAGRDSAALDLRHTTVRASVGGILSNMRLQPGEYIEAGDRVFTIVATDRPWVEANLKETQLTQVRIGQPATVEVDAYPGRVWDAVVASISSATGAEFAVLPPQNATGNWVKVVQRLPVLLRVLDPTDDPPLRAGMTVTATIDTGRERRLSDLLNAFADPAPQGSR